jgi:putative DNA primase/helicase
MSWEVCASDERSTLAAGLKEIRIPALIDLLSQAASWRRYDARARKLKAIDPPSSVASIVLSRAGSWRLPSLLGVITTPTMRRDGSIVSEHGYDKANRLFHMLDPGLRMQPIGYTRIDAELALLLLQNLLTGFPFVNDVDRAVGLAGLISPVARGAIGMVPLTALTAPSAGTGKSYYVDLASAIPTGRICPVATAGKNEEETEKRITGLLLAGFPVFSIDNLSDELGGDLLCQAVERPIIRVRPLGQSDIVEIESRATLYATGNNLTVAGDMTRRTLVAHLDARMERPEERQFPFDPVQRVIADRGTYVAACLTIVPYLEAGTPGQLPQLPSFGAWSDLVRSSLVWLGCADPAQSIQDARRSDPVLETLRQIMDSWRACFGSHPQTARTVAASLEGFDPSTPGGEALLSLRAALALVASDRGQIDASKLGYWLRKSRDRIVGGWKFYAPPTLGGVATWAVINAEL